MKPRIVIRVDGNAEIGLGHFTRCLALAEMLRESFSVTIAIQNPAETLQSKCAEMAFGVVTLPETTDYLEDAYNLGKLVTNKDIVVLDGYQFDQNYQKTIKAAAYKLVSIDDIHAWHFVSDVIINPNPIVTDEDYSKEPYCHLYSGLDYALLRKEFLAAATEKREITVSDTAFICFGGSDFQNLTPKAIDACLNTHLFKKINVVTGSAYPNLNELQSKFEDHKQTINYHSDISAAEMVAVLKKSHLAICPSSSIALEVFCVGLSLVTGYYAENQKDTSRYIETEKLGLVIGDLNEISLRNLEEAIKAAHADNFYVKQKKLVHGQNAAKIKSIFESLV